MPGRVTIRVTGVKAMQRRLFQVGATLATRTQEALRGEAKSVMVEAVRRAPYDDGNLRNDARVHEPATTVSGWEVTMTFGESGPSSAYALAAHETPSPHDPPAWLGKLVTFHTPGTGAKYLEAPLFAAMSGMDVRIASKLKL